MSNTDIDSVGVVIGLVVCGFVILIINPYPLFTNFEDSIPTERWCNGFNESFYMEEYRLNNPTYAADYIRHIHFCVKNESGWHLNKSVPVVLV